MNHKRKPARRKGLLTFEWILLVTLMVIGIMGGITILRDVLIVKTAQAAEATLRVNHSYHIAEPPQGTQHVVESVIKKVFGGTRVIPYESTLGVHSAQGSNYEDSMSQSSDPLVSFMSESQNGNE